MKMKAYYRWLLLTAAAGWLGGVFSGGWLSDPAASAEKFPAHKKTVTAEDFHLVDKEGKLRGALFVSAQGEPGFALFDKDGKNRILLMVHADGSALIDLLDQEGNARARLGLANDGSSGLKLVGDPTVALFDKAKKPIWNAP
ncbi:MAG: hypothetical protein EPO39_12400 [Candidatus Manganitrophaceae bacterium]|nr:MAG: hypothetical protein EPO39_12400 [Candidatus Manganitrophaceae bacterium]